MDRTRRHRARNSGRFYALPVSVLALLAFAFFPVAAYSSSIPEYTDAPPTVTDKTGSGGKVAPESPANASDSDTDGGSSHSGGGLGSGSSGDDTSSESGGAATGRDGGSGQQGSPGTGSEQKPPAAEKGIDGAKSVASAEDEGGSSPLIPILLAVLVLAAISAAVLFFRKRRGSDGSSGTPASAKAS